jgi:hypothetical protein
VRFADIDQEELFGTVQALFDLTGRDFEIVHWMAPLGEIQCFSRD